MSSAFKIKQNDTAPSLSVTLAQDGVAVDLTDAAISFHMRDDASGEALVNGTAVVVDAILGAVRYDWLAVDTALAGCFPAEFEVTFSTGKVTSYPNDGNLTIIITEDLR